ncbi:SERTA domain-containing protein 3 [Xyrichtys novacula]|uniref:SERTA domain-containing protein 3 n=1 Tax=Xyrichtys novacula TaxID=13765 RepID=A0AAV1FUK7_XYRNO|nr:SERTA domain-containing protein 3 [Xyrichtys novacula]
MIMKGQKRKLPPEDMEDRSSHFWESQRQFVFSVSLNKYQRSQELPEPSLRRSVLIANTLRQVSLEASRAPSVDWEVSQSHYSSPSSLLALSSVPLVPLSNMSNCATNVHLPVKDEDEDWGSMSMDSDFSLSASISSILTALDSTMDAGPRTPLRSLENLSAPFEGGVAGMRRGVGECGDQQGECRAGSSYLTDLTVEDLFQDIDTSLLEKDMCVLGLRGGASVASDELLRYLPPLSSVSASQPFPFSLNQNFKCLPSFSSFSPSSSSSSPPLSPPFSAQNHVKEGFELEHLMEILVES